MYKMYANKISPLKPILSRKIKKAFKVERSASLQPVSNAT